jgi:Phage terminase, small subunit
LTEKQRLFADEYRKDLDAVRAYMAAYPSVKNTETARAAAARLLENPEVAAYLRDRQEHGQVRQDEVLQGIMDIAFESGAEDVSTKDRLRALELLGRHLRLFSPRGDRQDGEDSAVTVRFVDVDGGES